MIFLLQKHDANEIGKELKGIDKARFILALWGL
jgi:hypothetical protein